jgi:hypothetical protein
MANDVTFTRPGGATARAVNQASKDEHGRFEDSSELLTATDGVLQDAAS